MKPYAISSHHHQFVITYDRVLSTPKLEMASLRTSVQSLMPEAHSLRQIGNHSGSHEATVSVLFSASLEAIPLKCHQYVPGHMTGMQYH